MLRPAIAAFVVGTLWVSSLQAQYTVQFETYQLDNGLTVILSQDHSAPIVTINVWYDVGSADERLNRSGFAHLFEHMMFEGSANVGSDEYGQLIQRAGGTLNGTTNEDRTAYYETLPSNRLNLGLWLEADRMRSLVITAENFEVQRNAVQEERRLRIDNQPYQPAFVESSTLLYDSTTCFGYAHTVIGDMADLNAAEVGDVQAFFDLYYAPNNATITVVGDFDRAEAKALIQQYYGDIPAGNPTPPRECEFEYNTGEKLINWPDKHATLPAVLMLYRTPRHDDQDSRALQLLGNIMGSGESSRLHRALVRGSQSALGSGASGGGHREAGQFFLFAIANQGVEADSLLAELKAQVLKVVEEGITEEELSKARNSFRASTIFGNQRTMSVSNRLMHYAHDHDSIDEINTDLDLYLSVTAEDIKRVANTYLRDENVVIMMVVPETEEGEEGVS